MHTTEAVNAGFSFLAPWLVFAPLTGLGINAVLSGSSRLFTGLVASLAVGAAFIVSMLLAYTVAENHGAALHWTLAEWIHIGNLKLDWAFRLDTLSTTMMLVVSGVGLLIHIYAIGYMHEDVRFKHKESRFNSFFIYLNLFIAAMMLLVSGDSYLVLFVGWEGVGLCSYLLIGFWYEMDTLAQPSWANSDAANKAFIVNRIGDLGFLIASFIMFWYLGTFQFDAAFAAAPAVAKTQPWIITAITLFMLIGVAGKSAQIPLFVWLPDAMAGPTPVSALIHAATMVTAGVYLVTRSAPLYALVPDAQYIVAMTGATTALLAATIAVAQYDIKRVLAYSTISQLGFMVAAVGMGAYVAGMFHLITHAFFKALLFLSAGSIILGLERGHHRKTEDGGQKTEETAHHHAVFDPGDMRNMGGMRTTMPLTFALYLIGTLALAGLPPFAGFWSKDEILLDASQHSPLIYAILTVAAFLTAFYMGRQIWMVFFGTARTDAAKHAQESPPIITFPLIILAILSITGGALNLPLPGYHTLTHWLSYTVGHVEALPIDWSVAAISTTLAILAIVASWLLYGRTPLQANQIDPLKQPLGPIFTGMEGKWFVDEMYAALIITPFQKLATFIAEVADRGGIDAFFNGWGQTAAMLSALLRKTQSGLLRNYATAILLGVVVMLGYLGISMN